MIASRQKCLLTLVSAIVSGVWVPAIAAEMKENLWELLEKPQYKPAWKALMLGHKKLPAWIKDGKGVSSPCDEINAGGKTYIVGDMCEPHNCAGHLFVAVFSKDLKQAWGLRSVQGYEPGAKSTKEWFGSPSPELKKLLEERLALRLN
jgi:hypothetical protein